MLGKPALILNPQAGNPGVSQVLSQFRVYTELEASLGYALRPFFTQE